jgi:hypothetical protein
VADDPHDDETFTVLLPVAGAEPTSATHVAVLRGDAAPFLQRLRLAMDSTDRRTDVLRRPLADTGPQDVKAALDWIGGATVISIDPL